MKPAIKPFLLIFLLLALPAAGENDDLAQVKEQELEEVRERISSLKQSMDAASSQRDKVTGELQAAEVSIAEKRSRLRDLERERAFTEKRRSELDRKVAANEAELDREIEHLGQQLRAAHMSGDQEQLKLLLNQKDPATLGRLMVYYSYLNDYRSDNIDTVSDRIRELASLRSQVAAEEARLSEIAKTRYA